MASEVRATAALLLSLNLFFYIFVSGEASPPPPIQPSPTTSPRPRTYPPTNAMASPPSFKQPPSSPPPPAYVTNSPPPMKASPTSPPLPANASCPGDALKLGVCVNVLDILKLKLGSHPKYPCCSLLEGLVDLEAAACLCIAIKANILGINLNLPIDLSLLINYCGKEVPSGFKCA